MANKVSNRRNRDLAAQSLAIVIGGVTGALIAGPIAESVSLPEPGMAQWGLAVLAALVTSGITAAWRSHQRDMQAVHQASTHRR